MPSTPRRPLSPQAALAKVEAMCARAEHCTHEVREKLIRWGVSAPDADSIIKSLEKRRYIDDKRFTNAYIRDKFKFARWGRRKIAMQLRLKHIDSQTIIDAMNQVIDPDEYFETILHAARLQGRRTITNDQGCKVVAMSTYEGRTRIYRHLLSRGFESDLAARALRQAYANPEN